MAELDKTDSTSREEHWRVHQPSPLIHPTSNLGIFHSKSTAVSLIPVLEERSEDQRGQWGGCRRRASLHSFAQKSFKCLSLHQSDGWTSSAIPRGLLLLAWRQTQLFCLPPGLCVWMCFHHTGLAVAGYVIRSWFKYYLILIDPLKYIIFSSWAPSTPHLGEKLGPKVNTEVRHVEQPELFSGLKGHDYGLHTDHFCTNGGKRLRS